MTRNLCLATLLVAVASTSFAQAQDRRTAALDANGNLDSLIAKHAAANNVPEALVRRVIKRESGGNPRAVSKGNYGLMQIRLGTARGLGYRGTAAGLLDADTNMTYAVRYLAGAYRVAGGDHNRAVHYYASGYYYAAKRKGMPVPGAATDIADARRDVSASGPGSAGLLDLFKSFSRGNDKAADKKAVKAKTKAREARRPNGFLAAASELADNR